MQTIGEVLSPEETEVTIFACYFLVEILQNAHSPVLNKKY